MDRPDRPSSYTDRELTQNAKDQPFPVIYGTVRCGGKVVFYKTDATQTQLAVDIVICEGPIEAIRDIKFGDYTPEELNCIKDGSTGSRYKVYLGANNQGVDPLCSSLEPLYCSGKPGTAHVTFYFDGNDTLCQKIDIYSFKCTVDGLKIRDPRLDSTLATRYFTNGSNLPPGKNNALATIDLLTAARYGAGFPDLQFDWLSSDTTQSWEDAANDCDYSLASRSGAPASAPTVAEGAYASGQMFTPFKTNYVYTYFKNGVESLASQASSDFTTTVNYSSATVTVTTGPSGTTERRVYRRKNMLAGGIDCDPNDTGHYLCGVIPDNTATTFVDLGVTREPTLAPGSISPCRYQIGLYMGEQRSLEEWLEIIRATFSGNFNYDGKFHCWIDKARSVSGVVFDESNIIGDIELSTVGLSSMYAKVKGTFVDSDAGFKNSDAAVEIPTLSQPPTEDEREEKRVGSYDMGGVPTYDQAMRLLRQILNRSRLTRQISFQAMYRGLKVMAGQVIEVTHRTGPLNATKVIVTGVRLAADGSVGISGEFYDAAIYSDDVQINPTPIVQPPAPALPPKPPTNCAVVEVIDTGPRGEGISRLKVTFTPSASPYATVTRVTVEKNSAIIGIIEAREGPILVENPEWNVEHELLVQAVGPDGRKSVAVILSITPQGSQTAPTAVSGIAEQPTRLPVRSRLTASGYLETIWPDYLGVSWDKHPNPDVTLYRIRSSDNLSAVWGDMTNELVVPAVQTGQFPARPCDFAGLVLWLRAHDQALADTTAVSNFPDASGQSHTFQQSTASLRPGYYNNAVSGRPSIVGDGSDDYMDCGSTLGIPANTGFAWFIVCQPPSGNVSASTWIADRTSNTTAYCSIGFDANKKYIASLHDDSSGSATLTATTAAVALTPVILCLHRDTVSDYLDLWINGTREVHTADSLGNLTPPTPRLWSKYDGTGSCGVQVLEVVVFDRSLTTAQRSAIEGYLNAKYRVFTLTLQGPTLPACELVYGVLAPAVSRYEILVYNTTGGVASDGWYPNAYNVMVRPEKYNGVQGDIVQILQQGPQA